MQGDGGDDYLYEEGHSFVAGGTGNDWIDSYGANAVIGFNAGDGADSLRVADALTLSLGGGIGEAGLSLRDDAGELVLSSGADSVRFSLPSWFAPGAWPAMRLQIVGEEIRVYDLNGIFDGFHARPEADRSSEIPIAELMPAHRTMSTYSQAYGGGVAALAPRHGRRHPFRVLRSGQSIRSTRCRSLRLRGRDCIELRGADRPRL